MEIKAHLNYLRIAPRKIRLVASLIKGMDTHRAEIILDRLPKRSALPVLKLLRSAIANAEHNFQLKRGDLYIKNILVNSGNVLKRSTPRAFGRAALIRKRTSHVSLTLDTKSDVVLSGKKKIKKTAPTVRDFTRDDVKASFTERQEDREIQKPKLKSPGFVKKIFQRKAI